MKRVTELLMKVFVLVLATILLVTGVTACSKTSSETTTTDSQIRYNPLSEVKCDGKEYNIAVKPKQAVALISAMTIREQNIEELKSSGLIQEISEIGRNEKASDVQLLVHYTVSYEGTQLTYGDVGGSGNVAYLASVPSENLDALFQKMLSSSDYSYQLLWSNTKAKDIQIVFTAKFTDW